MGTVLTVHVCGRSTANAVIEEAFELAARLETKLSRFNPESDVFKLERGEAATEDTLNLLAKAEEICTVSRGAFTMYPGGSLDLTGIAKGYILDLLCELLSERLPGSEGSVNAGGDLRFFNTKTKRAAIRVGSVAREIEIQQDALATSSFMESDNNPASKTIYFQQPARGLRREYTVSVEAPTCAIADALTKVGWFASADVAQACAGRYRARILVFSPDGALIEHFAAS
jgi:thiamine biosynthesis lipoprotein ApbE